MWRILTLEFLNDLRTQKTRAFLTMFAITWGTLAIILLLSFGEGLKNTFVAGLANAGDQVFFVFGGQTGQSYEGMPRGRPIRLTEDDAMLLERSIPEIDMISASFGRWGSTLEHEGTRTTAFLEGVNPSFEEMRRMYPEMGGRFLNPNDVELRRRVVFLGHELAETLSGSQDPVGKVLMLDGVPFTVIGIMQEKIQTAMMQGPDATRAVIPSSTFKAIYGPRFVNHLVIRPRDVTRAPLVKNEIRRTIAQRFKFHPEDERAVMVWDMIEAQEMTSKVMFGIQIFLGVIGGLTLFIAGVGVANIMYVVVKERTLEIGVKRAVGAQKRHIVSQFIFEALAIALTGGFIGMGIATLIVRGVAGIPEKEGAMEFLGNPELSVPIALTVIGVLTLIGLTAGVFPARKAAQVDPVEALRYE